MSVRGSLSVKGAVLNMNQVNDEYVLMLKEHHLECGWHFKKYLRDLMLKNIPNVEFVKSVSPSEAEKFKLCSSVSQVLACVTQDLDDPIFAALLDVSKAPRHEILEREAWRFSGYMGSFKNPPILQVFVKHLLLGRATIVGEKREEEEKKTVDRQVKLKSKTNVLC